MDKEKLGIFTNKITGYVAPDVTLGEIEELFIWCKDFFSNQVDKPVMPMDDTIKMLYEKLRAQISIYAGKKDVGLATLQDLYSALNDGETIICECCGQRITGKGGHLMGCDIVKKYFKVFRHLA